MTGPAVRVTGMVVFGAVLVGGISAAGAAPDAKAILEKLDSRRGIGAVVGEGAGDLAMRLARASELVVYAQLPDAKAVTAARRVAAEAGLLNKRVCVEQGSDGRIHLADNLADVVVVAAGSRAGRKEVLRVLRPGGKGLIGGETIVKPALQGTDDWSHPYHGPDNNPQSADKIARAPYLTQFLTEPWYCPMPEVTVAAGGRVFKAFGSRAFRRPQWQMLNTLIAINGYNGTRLWQRKLPANFMIHRNTMIATPRTLYLADHTSCKLLDAATGKVTREIKVPGELSDGPVWKWLAMDGGTLYALVGEAEPPGDALKGPAFRGAGWPWWKIPKYAWGFGRTVLAIDPDTGGVKWHHRETEPLDTRAMCMKGGRIYFYSHRKFLGCLDAKTGKVLWKSADRAVLSAIGEHRPAQRAVWGFASSAYVKCGEKALYFAGPQRTKLVAVSTDSGKLLWQYPAEGNFQLVLRGDALYAMGSNHPSQKFDLLTGKVLARLPNRAACTRATGSVDRVFVRGGGTRCWEVATGKWLHLSPMRPACHDGVVISDGQLYWGPWMCGCNLSLLGIISLRPAGDFNYSMKATDAERLQRFGAAAAKAAAVKPTPDDWPTFRKDNARTACSPRPVAAAVARRWQFKPSSSTTPTAPVTAGGLVFVGGCDGVVRALSAADGKPAWTAYTGGGIKYPPAIADGRALVGSADGWIYAFEAASGRMQWRFRAAPVERKIPVYGSLSSTWPVAAGVVAAGGRVYAAAGIANYDGTHVYALDAANGKLIWQNSTSGHTAGGQGAGASVQGHLLLHGKRLYLAGGNRVAVAAYDIADGTFRGVRAVRLGRDRRGPRGKDLFLRRDGSVSATGLFPLHTRDEDFHYIEYAELACPRHTVTADTRSVSLLRRAAPRPVWTARPFAENVALAVAANAVIVAGTHRRFAQPTDPPAETYAITALNLDSGKPLWTHRLPAGVVSWGIAVDRAGRILVALRDGRVLCFAAKE